MLAMGGEGDLIDRLIEMNIVPLSISYEYDPCDYLKAREYQLKRDVLDYKKSTADDLKNMETGMFGFKGRVHFHVAPCINDQLRQLDRNLSKQELFASVSAIIDRGIHANYRFYPNNYVAHDLLNYSTRFSNRYSKEDKERFKAYLAQQIEKIDIEDKDVGYLRHMLLLMYANPLTNYLRLGI